MLLYFGVSVVPFLPFVGLVLCVMSGCWWMDQRRDPDYKCTQNSSGGSSASLIASKLSDFCCSVTDCCDFCDLFLVFDRVLIATFDIILYVTSTSSLRCLRFLNYSEGSHRGWKKEQKQRKQTREKEKKITWTTFWPLVPSYCLDVWMWRSTLHSFQHLAHPHHSKMSVSYSPSSSHFQVFDVFEIVLWNNKANMHFSQAVWPCRSHDTVLFALFSERQTWGDFQWVCTVFSSSHS